MSSMETRSFGDKYRLFRSLPGFRRDNWFFVIAFAATLVLSFSIPLFVPLEEKERTSFFLAGAGANLVFWGVCAALYHIVLPAVLPYDKLRQRVEEARQSQPG